MASWWTITVDKVIPLPGGERMIRGSADGYASYTTGGDDFDLSAYFDSASYPFVQASNADGYMLSHDGGTAADGVLKALDGYGSEVASATDLSDCSINFFAIGDAK